MIGMRSNNWKDKIKELSEKIINCKCEEIKKEAKTSMPLYLQQMEETGRLKRKISDIFEFKKKEETGIFILKL